jgi:hypothetical protein
MVEDCAYDKDGKLIRAIFDRSEAFVRHSYHYKPDYTLHLR